MTRRDRFPLGDYFISLLARVSIPCPSTLPSVKVGSLVRTRTSILHVQLSLRKRAGLFGQFIALPVVDRKKGSSLKNV